MMATEIESIGIEWSPSSKLHLMWWGSRGW